MLSRFPFPLEKGDKLRAFNQIRELSDDFEIHLIAISGKSINDETKNKLAPYCQSIHIIRINAWSIFWNCCLCLLSNKPFQTGYFRSFAGKQKVKQLLKSINPDHIYCQLIRVTEYVKDYHLCSKTLDYMDTLSVGIERRISKVAWYKKWIFKQEYNRLKNYERIIFDYFEYKTIISNQDKSLIHHPEKASIACIPNGIDQSFFEYSDSKARFDIVFVGNLSYAPNIEAVNFIANKILHKAPSISCLISGANPGSSVSRLCRKNPQITLQSWVDDIRTAYSSGKIMVAPMMIGTGMQNKLLEAMALGIPCVTTSLANNAIQATNNESILVANTNDEFVAAIHKLLNDADFYNKIAQNGQAFVRNHYTWKTTTEILKKLISQNS
jgi:glycosyltransferase involved in cell wall biosynthesis